ncbi:MAG: hypothetical protein GX446_16350 [Chthonomonadales bacterium]|nr:hypothetical protein [Chthonomonadales bacterium]
MRNASANRLPKPAWYRTAGADQDVVVSTRCRLARNLEGFPFPWRASSEQLGEIVIQCARGVAAFEPHAVRIGRPVADSEALHQLLTARYVSFKWAEMLTPGSVHVFPDGSGSIMVNEEDHLRIQTLRAGLDVETCLNQAQRAADALGRQLAIASSSTHGFLTASLCNTGSGLRLSCLLHLAALAATPAISEALAAARRMNCVVRGAFGEGSSGTGSLVQVSNRCTWGVGAAYAVEQAVAAVRYLVVREREAREAMMRRPGGKGDLIAAAEGASDLLLHEDLSAADIVRSLSVVRLGMAMGATSGTLLRTGEWMALAGLLLWSERRQASGVYERVRVQSAVRAGLRACLAEGSH